MSKYVRTKKDGNLFEVLKSDEENVYVKAYDYDNDEWYTKNIKLCDVRQADTVEELCDEFVVLEYGIESGVLYSRSQYIILEDAIASQTAKHKCSYEIYGAIWTEGDKGEPILMSVAKMNEKGELELL